MKLPNVTVQPDVTALMGGMDRISTSMTARPGTASYSFNYEAVFGGGFGRVGGIERFSGKQRPSDAVYVAFPAQTFFTVNVGDIVQSPTTGASATCIFATSTLIVLTRISAVPFVAGEEVEVGGNPVGVLGSGDPGITAMMDNQFRALAAASYRVAILAVPGAGPVRGIAALKGTLYAWRNNLSNTKMELYKSTPTIGWQRVALGEYVVFSDANTSVGAADTLTQGTTTATILAVILESGTLASGVNTGKLLITARVNDFAPGAATSTGGGLLTLSAAQVGITLLPSGRVLTDVWNFTASTDTTKIYGCDGVNPEFEYDGTLYVPLTTGQSVRATTVRCHKNHVFFGFRGSVQHSGIADPYKYTAVSGASELGTGDVVTGFISVPGSEDRAAMLILCQDSTWVLFGNSADIASPTVWQMTPLSRDAGANAFSVEDTGEPMAHDAPGMRVYKTTQNFGNFAWELASRMIERQVQNKTPRASCFTKAFSRYRLFFTDGTAISGTPGPGGWEWTLIDYGRNIMVAYSTEMSGATRTFYGDDQGFVYEADVGRSFDGANIFAVLRLNALHQRAPMMEKTYRYGFVETLAEGAFTLNVAAEFNDSDTSKAITPTFSAQLLGAGAQWDTTSWDQVFWDSKRLDRRRIAIEGSGYNAAPVFYTDAADELPHQLKTVTLIYTPRRIAR